jgi:hypothetical protein
MKLPSNIVTAALKTQRSALIPRADCHTLKVVYPATCFSTSAGSVLHHKRNEKADFFDFLVSRVFTLVIGFPGRRCGALALSSDL